MSFTKHLPLIVTAITVLALILARAHVQSITIDEATTFKLWVAPHDATYWSAASNNHILNSLVMKLAVSVFGISHLTVRSGALAGALLYVIIACLFCMRLTENTLVQWTGFVCLTMNPFMLDFLVAARGYALASAFLLASIYIIAADEADLDMARHPSPARACIVCSASSALSIAANFAFAFVCVLIVSAFTTLLCVRAKDLRQRVGIFAAGTFPALLLSAVLTLPALMTWPEGQLWWGAKSLHETASSLKESVLYQPNPHVLNPVLYSLFSAMQHLVLPSLGIGAILALAAIAGEHLRNRRQALGWRVRFTTLLFLVLGLTILTHWLASKMFRILLPLGRTGLYVVLVLGAVGAAIASVRLNSRPGRMAIACMQAVLVIASLYFLGCLRLSYFKEWEWDADVRQAYWIAAWYNRTHGVRRVASSWHYSSALNFYRTMSGRETIDEVRWGTPIPAGYELYVLHGALDQRFVDQQHLRVVYRSENTEMIVAIDAEVERRTKRQAPE